VKLVIEMSLDNAAFNDWPGEEAGRVVGAAIDKLSFYGDEDEETDIFDLNGNRVGTAKVVVA